MKWDFRRTGVSTLLNKVVGGNATVYTSSSPVPHTGKHPQPSSIYPEYPGALVV